MLDFNKIVKKLLKKTWKILFKEEVFDIIDPEKAGENLETSEFKQNPNYPIIKRFTEIQWVNISSEDMLKINKVLLGLEDFDILKLEKNLKGNFFSDPKLEPCLLRYLLKITRLNPQLIRNEDLKIEKIDLPKEFKNNDILNDENSEIIKLLAQNYIKIPDWVHWEPNFDKDIQTCFDITVNKIIDKKQFQENESFGIAMQDIKSGDIETKLQAITYIYSLVNTSQWIWWKRSAELFRQMLQEHSKKKKDYFELKTVKLETKLKDETDDQKRKDIMQEIENLNKRKNEDDFSWEVFSAWKQDYISDKAPGE